MAALTPMMAQYMEVKNQYKDCILFYRLGDFYEMFFDDALTASRELEITLTGRDCGQEEWAPMCGVPYHACDIYLNKLIEKGYKVAICEQMEDPKLAKGIVKREVIRIVTPGTNMSQAILDETRNNYLMCIFGCNDEYGVAVCDITTGEFRSCHISSTSKLYDEINSQYDHQKHRNQKRQQQRMHDAAFAFYKQLFSSFLLLSIVFSAC